MLAYRHSFHAGNHADVLKHVVQTAVLNYFNEKDKPYWVVDTHAGAGVYSLSSKHAQRNSEHLDGISKLFTKEDLPALLAQYIDLVKHTNSTTTHPDKLTLYPGSTSSSCMSCTLLISPCCVNFLWGSVQSRCSISTAFWA
jgi:23S rRNA (adenine2030-N6)-methyltransferase